MTNDKTDILLLEALRQALAEPGEQRLYKSGKLPGLFASRAGAAGEAAGRAVRDGLVEVVRTEVKGKTAVEWVRLTPRGVEFLHAHESPVEALRELRAVLQPAQAGVPLWLAEVHQELEQLSATLTREAQRWSHRLEALSQRVEEALRRAEADAVQTAGGMASVPWALEALAYLDRRRAGGAASACPLPELFAALRGHWTDLALPDFHAGLRHLSDRRAVRLLPFAGAPHEIPEPEYALLDGADMLFYATR